MSRCTDIVITTTIVVVVVIAVVVVVIVDVRTEILPILRLTERFSIVMAVVVVVDVTRRGSVAVSSSW